MFASLLSRLRNVKPLNLMACSYEQKKVLYEIANMSFSSQSANSFFNLITNYLGKKKELLCPQINSKLQGVNGHTLTLFGTIPEMCYLLLFWSSIVCSRVERVFISWLHEISFSVECKSVDNVRCNVICLVKCSHVDRFNG